MKQQSVSHAGYAVDVAVMTAERISVCFLGP